MGTERDDSDGRAGPVDPDVAVRHVVDDLCTRYPRFPRATIERRVRQADAAMADLPVWVRAVTVRRTVEVQLAYVSSLGDGRAC